ncbi:hypothetical protein PspLS_10237 [Pyricularia sp. CBS 133598]|nr:hypothetical protein PspLS_10237 [Pyricularia sp. CBS 133598]
MEDDDRESNASSDNEQDEVMEDAVEEPEAEDNDGEDEEDNENENDDEEDDDGENEDADVVQDKSSNDKTVTGKEIAAAATDGGDGASTASQKRPGSSGSNTNYGSKDDRVAGKAPETDATREKTPAMPIKPGWRPKIDPTRISARLYDIVPTMAAPQATSINAFAATPDQRFWVTGGSDGYVRKYDAQGTINGKLPLTVAQRHPFVDSVVKAGILMSYWENEEVSGPSGGSASTGVGVGGVGSSSGALAFGVGAATHDHVLSPVYSIAVQAQGLWVLSGTEGGGINLSSGRHEEGKRIACLHKHSSAVSVLTMLPDEKTVLSGSWDKTVADWDLNNGQVRRTFVGSGSQISVVELRPLCGAPVPSLGAVFDDETNGDVKGSWSTMSGNNDAKFRNGSLSNGVNQGNSSTNGTGANGAAGLGGTGSGAAGGDGGAGTAFAQTASPAHESLFGSPAGSLFGDDTIGGNGNVFGDDDDDFNTHTMDMDLNGGGESGQNGVVGAGAAADDVAMGGTEEGRAGDAVGETGNNGASAAQPPDATAATTGDDAAGASQATTSSGTQLPPSTAPPTTPAIEPTSTAETDIKKEPALPSEPAIPAAISATENNTDQPNIVFNSAAPEHADPTQMSDQIFLSASIDGTLRIWDRRVRDPVARIGTRPGVPPWCMGACWSPDGNWIYAGRRNGTVEEYSIHKARSGWAPDRALKLPAGSGAVSAVRAMPNGRHLVVASHDILRLYDLRDSSAFKGSSVPFLIVPGPPRAGVIAQLYIDPSARFMVSIAGTRGWDGTSTECLVGYEINVAG